jgi:hypothetical protein
MTNKSRTIFRSVRLFGSDRDARARGRGQRVLNVFCHRAGDFRFLNAERFGTILKYWEQQSPQ